MKQEHEAVGLFSNLLAPLTVASKTLRNRVIMGSMHTRLETETDGIEKLAAFYAERARGEAGLIITGGYAPNKTGLIEPGGPRLDTPDTIDELKIITRAVHDEGGLICAQILHAGRYAKQENCVGPSDIRSPINRYKPTALTGQQIDQTIDDFVTASQNAQLAGFDGVEIMGSEGYLINEFTTQRCNNRQDDWGGSSENRHRLPIEIVRKTRAACGADFIIIYRISSIDLVEGGATGDEIIQLARSIQDAGADILNTGIGWHEARVPTIGQVVPRGAWRQAVSQITKAVNIPVVASNRINTPEIAEEILARGDADLVSMARPMLADPFFVQKTRQGMADQINTCIACNQACLDFIFSGRTATCLVNPRAGRETEFSSEATKEPKAIAVIGGGAAGMACAVEAARCGHSVTLFEADDRLGGQLNLASVVPGKDEFNETIRYYTNQLLKYDVQVKLTTKAKVADIPDGVDHVVIATGVTPRIPDITGHDHPKVATYADILSGKRVAGRTVAIIGSGGIGFDVAEFLAHDFDVENERAAFFETWSVDPVSKFEGGLTGNALAPLKAKREIIMLQRKPSKPGISLGVSTGWIHRSILKKYGVENIVGATYELIDNEGLHITQDGKTTVIAADTIVICAGQESELDLSEQLQTLGTKTTLIGGAKEATELDAMRAIDEGVRLALSF